MDYTPTSYECPTSGTDDYTTPFWCPYTRYAPSNPNRLDGDYTTVETGPVTPSQRSTDANTAMPPAPVHGGLYNAPETKNPWNAIAVTPTMTNYIQFNLRSANPPPGATEQYVGTERPGNNYAPMPGTYWFNPKTPEQQGKHMIKVTHGKDRRTYKADGTAHVAGPQSMF